MKGNEVGGAYSIMGGIGNRQNISVRLSKGKSYIVDLSTVGRLILKLFFQGVRMCFVYTVMNPRVPCEARNFLTS